jgi:hypothetical protein
MATSNWYTEAKDTYKQRSEAEAQKLGINLPSNFTDLANSLGSQANYQGDMGYWGRTYDYFYKTAVNPDNFNNSANSAPYHWVAQNFTPEKVVQLYKNNPDEFYRQVLNGKTFDYINIVNDYQQSPNAMDRDGIYYNKVALDKATNDFKNLYIQGVLSGVSTENLNKYINKGYTEFQRVMNSPAYSSADSGFWKALGIFLEVGTPLAFAAMTAGLSLPQQIVVNSMYSLSRGASAQDIVRSIVGAVAADQVAGALKDINTQIAAAGPNAIKPEVVAALSNAERQAVNAVFTKQDIGAAALAGAGGGAVASATSLATDSAAIQRAAGEYVQARLAGKTKFEALTSSLSGFVNQQEKDAAQQKVLDEAAKNPDIAKLEGNQVGALTGDQAGGTTGDPTKSLPPVTVTATDEKVLPQQESVGSFSGTEESQLSLQNKALQTDTKAQPKTSKTNNAILLSLINKPLSRSVPIGGSTSGSPTQTSSTVGSQALGQALRVGDAGAPVFGGDKDKSKRSGWNTESLRYMGNSGDSNG